MAQIYEESPGVEAAEIIYDSLRLPPLNDVDITIRLLMPGKVRIGCFENKGACLISGTGRDLVPEIRHAQTGRFMLLFDASSS